MASFVWECLFCLLPSVCFFLALRWPSARCWTRQAVRAAGRWLWVIACLILELKPYDETRKWDEEGETAGTGTGSGPRLICKPTALAKYLLQNCGSLAGSKLATWPRGDPHLQTVSSQLCGHVEDVQFTRDHLLLKDGGVVALDWAVGTRFGEATMRRKVLGCFTSTPPVLLLIPQSWGGVNPHLKLLCQQAMRQGFYVVVFHHRGTGGSPLTTARLTEFGDPSDLEQAVSYVRSRHLSSMLVAISEGSGSGVLLSYLGEQGSGTYLTAAAAISPVLLGQLWFETALPPVYRWAALLHRKMQLSRYESSFRGVLDVDRALGCSNLRDFEEALFCSSEKLHQQCSGSSSPRGLPPAAAWTLGERAHQARTWESYWERNEPLRDADEVAVPVLCICSGDDPLLPPASTLPTALFLNNPYFLLVPTDRGGHCGFTLEDDEGIWSHVVVLEYFRVVAEFLKEGESWRGDVKDQIGQKSRTNAAGTSRRRRAAMTRRPRVQMIKPSCEDDGEGGNFTWRRSYTR